MSIEEIRNKLLNYFVKNAIQSNYLEILDEGSRIANSRGYYTGVSIPYIKKFVLQNEDISDVKLFFVLGQLHIENIISILFCVDIKKTVVENYNLRKNSTNGRLVNLGLNSV